MEFVIKGKNTTTACDGCHKAKRKCSGTMPCELCVQRGRTCVFNTQLRRGHKRKIIFMTPESYEVQNNKQLATQQATQLAVSVASPNVFNTGETTLWCENERLKTIDSMLKLRGWLKPVLDYNTLTGASEKSNSLPIQIQTICMAACMARFHGFYDSARNFADMASELSSQLFGDCSTDVATAFMLLADATPKKYKYYATCARNISKQLAAPRTVREARLHTYIYLTNLIFNDQDPTDVRAMLAQYEKQMNDRAFPTEIWDVMSRLILRVLSITLTKFGYFTSEAHDAIMLCRNVRESVFSKEELDNISADLQMFEFIMDSNIDIFGREFYFWYRAMKLLTTWKRGELDQAYIEAMQFLTTLRNVGKERAFLIYLTMYIIPLMILHEKGMLQPLRETIDYLSIMFQSTEQQELGSAVIPFFLTNKSPQAQVPHQATFLDTQAPFTSTPTIISSFQSIEPLNSPLDSFSPHTSTEYYPPITPQSNYSPPDISTPSYSPTYLPTNLALPTDIPFYEVPNSPYLSFSFNQ